MAKASRTWKLVVTTIIISLVILAAFTAVFITLIVPAYDITREQIYSILTRVFPVLIGLILIEIALVVGRTKDDDFKDNIDKLSPNAYDMPFYTPAVDDPLARGNISAGEVFDRVKEENEKPNEKEVIKEVPVEVVKEIVKEVPVEVIKEIPVEVVKEVPYPVFKEIPVEVIREVVREVPVEVIKEIPSGDSSAETIIKEIEKPIEVPVPYEVVKEIEVPVDVIKEVQIPAPAREVVREVIKEVPVEIIKEVPVEVIKEVPAEGSQIIEKVVEVPKEDVTPVYYNFRETLQNEMEGAKEGKYDLCLAAFKGTEYSRIERYLGKDTLLFQEDGVEYAILPYYRKDEAEKATRLLGDHAVIQMKEGNVNPDSLIRELKKVI